MYCFLRTTYGRDLIGNGLLVQRWVSWVAWCCNQFSNTHMYVWSCSILFKPHSSSLQCHMAAVNLRFVVAAADCSLFTYFFNRFFFGSFATSLSSLAFGLYVAVTMSSFSHHFDRFSDLVILKSVVATLFLEQLYSNLWPSSLLSLAFTSLTSSA